MKELQQLAVLTGLSPTVSDVDAHKQFREPSERVSESPGVVTQPRSARSGLHSISNLIDAYMAVRWNEKSRHLFASGFALCGLPVNKKGQ